MGLAATLGPHELRFRALTYPEAKAAADAISEAPEEALEIAIAACRAACLDVAAFDLALDEYPLAFAGDESIFGALLRQASDNAAATVKAGSRLWKASDRNLGLMAQNLLAFKAYTGGPWDEKTFAGALTVSEWMTVTKGTFQLFLALMKALAKKRK